MSGIGQNKAALEKARLTRIANKEKGIKPKNPLEKAKDKPKSFRLAANAMCYQCIYDPLDKGTWRQQIGKCTSPDCALYPLRPKALTRAERGIV